MDSITQILLSSKTKEEAFRRMELLGQKQPVRKPRESKPILREKLIWQTSERNEHCAFDDTMLPAGSSFTYSTLDGHCYCNNDCRKRHLNAD